MSRPLAGRGAAKAAAAAAKAAAAQQEKEKEWQAEAAAQPVRICCLWQLQYCMLCVLQCSAAEDPAPNSYLIPKSIDLT